MGKELLQGPACGKVDREKEPGKDRAADPYSWCPRVEGAGISWMTAKVLKVLGSSSLPWDLYSLVGGGWFGAEQGHSGVTLVPSRRLPLGWAPHDLSTRAH